MRLRLTSGFLLLCLMLLVLLLCHKFSEEHGFRNLSSLWIGLEGLVQKWIRILCVVRTLGRQVVYRRMFLAILLPC